MERPTCGTCPFWDEYAECHGAPPTSAGFPRTTPGEWCGMHPEMAVYVEVERRRAESRAWLAAQPPPSPEAQARVDEQLRTLPSEPLEATVRRETGARR